jgi:AraC-like DNA-binding protein
MTTRSPGAEREKRRFEAAIDLYLHDCYRDRTVVRVAELASILGLSRQRINEAISAAFGMGPLEILRERQLVYAAGLLVNTPLEIEDVAAASGFGHRATLYRAFVRAYGLSPTQFRRADKMQPPRERPRR